MLELKSMGLDHRRLVPTYRFLLVSDGSKTFGSGGIRTKTTKAGDIVYQINPPYRNQGYGKQLLKLLLLEAKQMGMNKAILVCKTTNLASKRIIEVNGGVFLEEIQRKKRPNRLKYQISLK